MSKPTEFSLQLFGRPLAALRRRQGQHRPGIASSPSPVQEDPERLERISAYARAGYFNMGYTFDMFPLVGDLPPH
jgi:hypothetical protein